jgi:HEAT repeat protein
LHPIPRYASILPFLLLSACGGPDKPGEAPDLPEPSTEQLLARATDPSVVLDQRVSAAEDLLGRPGGAATLAGDDATGRHAVRVLLDSLLVRDAAMGARLAAAMMSVAQGEAKLDFEVILLRQGEVASDPLMGLLAPGHDWQTRVRALDALGKLKLTSALDTISTQLAHPNTWVRMAAAHALGDIGGADALPLLSSALADTAHTVVAATLIALGHTGLEQAVTDCARHLAHPNPRVRAAAVSALGRLGGSASRLHLEPMRRDPDAGVRYKAERALEQLKVSQ